MTPILDIFNEAKDYRKYAPGETVFEEGQRGDNMYVLVEGEVEISVKGKTIDVLSAGDIFGEMALVDDAPRSATAKTKTECKIVPVDQYNFTFYVQHSPFFALHVMSTMAQRLRRRIEMGW